MATETKTPTKQIDLLTIGTKSAHIMSNGNIGIVQIWPKPRKQGTHQVQGDYQLDVIELTPTEFAAIYIEVRKHISMNGE